MAEVERVVEEGDPRMIVRPLRSEDFDALVALQVKCFPGMKPWARDQFESQLANFAEGQLGIEVDGKLVASSANLIVDFDQYSQWHNWKEIADSGYIRNHDPQGDVLYGIEIMVDPEFRGRRLARRLYDVRKEIARKYNLRSIIVGGRIPGYGQHAQEMSAREYVERVMRKEFVDPVLTTQVANGFSLRRLIPDYFPSDTDSRGYATFLEWINLDYTKSRNRRFRAESLARICVVQYEMRRISNFDEFAQQCEFFTDTASDSKSDFVLFPELITTQLLSIIEKDRPGMAARKLAEYTPQYRELFTHLAMKYSINIVGGSHFVVEGDRLYNVSFLFRRDGSIGKQAKLHITPSERKWWGVSPGNGLEVFDSDCGKIAILVCYDIEFPELARVVTAKGARMIFVPFNTNERFGYLRVRHCAQARAIENEVYVAIAGCTGNLPFVENADVHYAQSGIFTPADFPFARDAIAAESGENVETVVFNDVDFELLRRQRLGGTITNWKDRRRDLYRIGYREADGSESHV